MDYGDIHTPRLGNGDDDNMPLQRCMHEGKHAWRWGDSGKAYTYDSDDEESEKAAKKKAIDQGPAIGGGSLEKAAPTLEEMYRDEIKGSSEYARASEEATDPDIKSMFLVMSQDELRHAEMLKTIMVKPLVAPAPESTLTEMGMSKSLIIDIAKIQDNTCYGIVLKANTEDLQGDIMSAEDIRVAMHGFMEEFRTINKDHADDIDACPVECWQAKEPGSLGNSRYGPGDWLMGVKIHDPEVLRAVHEGKLRSYSIEGVGQRVPLM